MDSAALSAKQVFDAAFFVKPEDWHQIVQAGEFDHIVLGTGFCGYAYVERVLKRDPFTRVLVIEQGPFLLPTHFQNLPTPFQRYLPFPAESFPWGLSDKVAQNPYLKKQRGMMTFFGGRSTMWSAWCPDPDPNELRDWPDETIHAVREYSPLARNLMNVKSVDHLAGAGPEGPIFTSLQRRVFDKLNVARQSVPGLQRVEHAQLAADPGKNFGIDFLKFATPGSFINLIDRQRELAQGGKGSPLHIVTDCPISKIVNDGSKATAIETGMGLIPVRGANVIVSIGTLPSTSLVATSFPHLGGIGERFGGHFVSVIICRIRLDHLRWTDLPGLQLGATYLSGMDPIAGGHWHLQLTSIHEPSPEHSEKSARRHMPDVMATASPAQLADSTAHAVFACAAVGELTAKNPENWYRKAADGTMTLQFVATATDEAVWTSMEEATFTAFEKALAEEPLKVEYWHPDGARSGKWQVGRPSRDAIRMTGLVHEACTMPLGKGREPVGLDYRLQGTANVFLTGGAIFPSAGSWNPTLAMTALAQHLADLRMDAATRTTAAAADL